MATRLDEHVLADALQALPEWQGDTERITRTASLDEAAADRLVADVQEAADAMDHHPQVERSGADLTFVLATHSAGGVTELDITLASRIDDLLRQASGAPRPTAADAPKVVRGDGQVLADAGSPERTDGAPGGRGPDDPTGPGEAVQPGGLDAAPGTGTGL